MQLTNNQLTITIIIKAPETEVYNDIEQVISDFEEVIAKKSWDLMDSYWEWDL